MCAVFKKGKKSDPANYRRISLTHVVSKILELIVHSFIMKHLNDQNPRDDGLYLVTAVPCVNSESCNLYVVLGFR